MRVNDIDRIFVIIMLGICAVALLTVFVFEARAGDPHHTHEPTMVNQYTTIAHQVIEQYECDARGSADHNFSYATRSVQVGVAGARCMEGGNGELSLGLGYRPCKDCGLGKLEYSNGVGGGIVSGGYTFTFK